MCTENIQITPTEKRTCLNDKATKLLFNITAETYSKITQGKLMGIVEKKNHKKKGKVKSGFTLQNENGYTYIAPLDEYDRAVFDVFISEYEEGNRVISVNMIYRALTGKIGEGSIPAVPEKQQIIDIRQAADKLMCTVFDPDILKAFEELKYDGAEQVVKSTVQPQKRTKNVTINGKQADEELIHFLDESPLYKIAKIKGQILTYDARLLDVPNQHNSRLTIMLKNYTLRRVVECMQHSKTFKPILTLDDIFEKCRIKDASKRIKQAARETLDKFFAHLLTQKIDGKSFIKSYKWNKKGNKFYSIEFTY